MTTPGAVLLERGSVRARVLPDEGGVLLDLLIAGRSVLTATPWADAIAPGTRPALTEEEWVRHWRGGWQLGFPTAGLSNPAATVLEGFHGIASQLPWRVTAVTPDSISLSWVDEVGLRADREWSLTDDGATVATRVRNDGGTARTLIICEHLILGGDALAGPLELDVPAAACLRPLDYSGVPDGDPRVWPGDPADRWDSVDHETPARVAAILNLASSRIRARGPHAEVIVDWEGAVLPHALIWEELGVSLDHPWNGQVRALGIEPTSTPHGAGTALDDGLVRLPPGGELDWSATLRVRWSSLASPFIDRDRRLDHPQTERS